MVKTTLPGGAQTRHPRPGTSLAARARHTHRLRRCAALTLAAGVAMGGLGAAGVPVLPGTDTLTPVAAADTNTYPSVGNGRNLNYKLGAAVQHWLGANVGPGGTLVWCIEFDAINPTPDQLKNPSQLAVSDQRGDVDASLRLNPAQAYTVFKQYQDINESDSRAALSILAHANYDLGSYVPAMMNVIAQQVPAAYAKAQAYADWARKNTPQNVEIPAATAPNAVRTGEIHDIQVKLDNGSPMTGVPVTVTLNGPAVFDATGTNTWTGKTESAPISVKWTSTGNGTVSFKTVYQLPGGKMVKYGNDGSIQDEIGMSGPYDPVEKPTDGEPFKVFYDFQPVGTSKAVWSKVDTKGELTDTFTTAADTSYTPSPEWMYDGHGNHVPVVYKATAYWSDTKPATSKTIPAGATKLGEVKVTAHGPGEKLTATLPATKQGWVTWVWSVTKTDQGDWASYIAGDWADSYGLDDETYPERRPFKPQGTSNVADYKITNPGKAPCDTFTPAADPKVSDGQWTRVINKDETFSKASYVPVVYTATAYRMNPETIPPAGPTVPATATKLGTVDVTATAPGKDVQACLPEDPGPGFLTWVWSVDKDKQTGPDKDFIVAGWADSFALPKETTSQRYRMEVDSTINIHHTKNGDYLSDDLFVTGLPENHTSFEGDSKYGFKLDVDNMSQTLYFFPKGLEVTEANKPKAEVIAEVQVDVRNGFYPHVGATKFKMKKDKDGQNTAGTYVFVTSFPGDDRVAPFTSKVTDTYEQTEAKPKPEIHTTATDKADGDKRLAPTGNVTISDKVCQVKGRGLEIGKTYQLTATAMDKDSGAPFKDDKGQPYTGTATFTPHSESDCGTVDVTIPARALWGKTIVMFEDVTHEGRKVAIHADIDDEGQTVEGPTPGITTTLTDGTDGDKEVVAGDVTLTDTIAPTSEDTWEKGKTYRISGTLMDKATGEPVKDADGKDVTTQTEFTAKSAGDKPTVTFTFNTEALGGHDVVAFDTTQVKNKDGKWEDYVNHQDIEAGDQTVHVRFGPEIGTTLTDATDGDHEVTAGPVTLTDQVCPKNEDTFDVGTTYTVKGALMDKATGKPVVGKDGAEVTAQAQFTPTKADECATVTFKFDTTDLGDHDVVAYEEAYDAEGNLYADHKDISDEGQTVHVKPAPPLPKTGAGPVIGLLVIAATGLIASGTALVARRRKNDSDGDSTGTGSGTADLENALA